MNKFLLKCSLLALCAGVLCLPANASAAEKKIIMRYSHSSAAQTKEPHHAAATAFKQKVEELSKGKVEVQIYPGSQLGGEERSFQDIQDFVAIATVQPFQVLVGNAHQKINGKSFMGMCTLDCRWPLDVTFQATDEAAERFRQEAARFLA